MSKKYSNPRTGRPTEEAIHEMLKSENSRMRAQAVHDVAMFSLNEAAPLVIERLLNDPSLHVRRCAFLALGYLKHPGIVEALGAALNDPDELIVASAVRELARFRSVESAGPIRRLLASPSWRVRFAACQSLVRLGLADGDTRQVIELLAAEPAAKEHDKAIAEDRKFFKKAGGPPVIERDFKVNELLAAVGEQLSSRTEELN